MSRPAARAVADATPLIYLARLGVLDAVAAFYGSVLVPSEVVDEVVVRGKELGRADAWAVEAALERKVLHASTTRTLPRDLPASLGRGERAVITLALREGCDALIDDREAYVVCRALGARPRRTTALLLDGVARGAWSPERFEVLLARLSEEGYFLTADVFRELVQRGRALGAARR